MKELKCGPGWVQCGCGKGTPYPTHHGAEPPSGPAEYEVVRCNCGSFLVFLGEFEDGSTQGYPDRKGWLWAVARLPDKVVEVYNLWLNNDLVVNWATNALSRAGYFLCRRCHQEEQIQDDNQMYPGAPRRCQCGHAAMYMGRYSGPAHPESRLTYGWVWKDDQARPFAPPTVVVHPKTTKYCTVALKMDKELRAAATDDTGNIVARRGPENWLHFASRDAAKGFLEQCRSSVDRMTFDSWVIIRHVSPDKVVPEGSK